MSDLKIENETVGALSGAGVPSVVWDAGDERLLAQLAARAASKGLSLAGEGGLLPLLAKLVLEAGLEAEMTAHLGYDKHAVEGRNGANSRNGTRAKTVITEVGPVEIEVPRDRAGTLDRVEVPVLSYEWWSHAKRTTVKSYPGDHFRLDGLPRIPDPGSRIPVPDRPVTLSVVASTQPQRVELKLFDTVSADVPTGERHSIECTQLCGTLTGRNTVTLRIRVPTTTKVAVLMLFWAVPLDQAHPQSPVAAYDYASYAFRPEPQ